MERLLYDLVGIVREIAEEKGYLASKEQIIYAEKQLFMVHYSSFDKKFSVGSLSGFCYGMNIIDTKEHAEEIAEMFNNDEGVKQKMKEYGLWK